MGLRRWASALVGAKAAGRVDELSEVARQSRSLFVTLEMKQQRRVLRLDLRGGPTWGYASAQQNGSARSYHPAASLGEALRALAKDVAGAGRLDWESLKCRCDGGPMESSALKDLSLAAVCEAFGEPVPTASQLAEYRESKRAAARERGSRNRALRRELLALLTDGDVAAWNARLKDAAAIAPLKKADLAGRDLSGARLVSMPEGRFAGAILADADLRNECFKSADFGRALLRGARLCKADVRQARFGDACLQEADLSGARLQGADFRGARLDGAKWQAAQFDAKTVWPDGFALPENLQWTGKGPNPSALAAIASQKRREGPIDLAAFMQRLEKAVDGPRMKKAVSMLKKESFQLFVETSDAQLVGVVKSQNDPELVYSGILAADGAFSCCTQNLNVCGGLRGALCKHLLVLIIGLAQSGEVDADTLDTWVQRSRLQQPALQKDLQSAVFLRYKGAEAGEIDWRPTETVPEDFYAY